jgi:hypothetical protein
MSCQFKNNPINMAASTAIARNHTTGALSFSSSSLALSGALFGPVILPAVNFLGLNVD